MDQFVDIAGHRLHYLDHGDPSSPPLILLHGFNQTAHSWDEFAERAAGDGFRVVALDQRGHGESDNARGGDYSREAMTADVLGLIDALGLARVAVIGMSMGSVHAIRLAAGHADRVSALVIVDYAPEVEASGVGAIVQVAMLAWDSFDDAVAAMMQFNPRRSADNLRARLHHSLRQHADGKWRWRVDGAGLAAHARFREPADAMWQAIRDVRCPTLLVRGGDSNLLSAQAADRVVDALADGRLVTIPGAGHSVPGDAPEAFHDAVIPFVRGRAA